LQHSAGTEPFFLACRTAGRLLKVEHVTVWRWLGLLVEDRVLELVEKGVRKKASRYHYVAED
jgi:hypothetical protein